MLIRIATLMIAFFLSQAQAGDTEVQKLLACLESQTKTIQTVSDKLKEIGGRYGRIRNEANERLQSRSPLRQFVAYLASGPIDLMESICDENFNVTAQDTIEDASAKSFSTLELVFEATEIRFQITNAKMQVDLFKPNHANILRAVSEIPISYKKLQENGLKNKISITQKLDDCTIYANALAK